MYIQKTVYNLSWYVTQSGVENLEDGGADFSSTFQNKGHGPSLIVMDTAPSYV